MSNVRTYIETDAYIAKELEAGEVFDERQRGDLQAVLADVTVAITDVLRSLGDTE